MSNIIFAIALIPPILYSIGNFLDKQLVHTGGSTSPTLIVTISSLLSIFVLPVIYIFFGVENIEFNDSLIMMLSGGLTVLSVFLYLKALNKESVFSVAPALQLAPVFSYFIGILFFGEFLSLRSIFGCLLIIIGSLFLTIKVEEKENKKKFNYKIFLITASSSLCLAISASLFKFFAFKYKDYWTVQFYEYLGLLFVGICLFLYFPNIRKNIFDMFTLKKNKNFLFLNLLTEIVMVLADLSLNLSVILVPIFIAFSFNALQPMFLIILGRLIFLASKKFDINLATGSYDFKTIFFCLIITTGVIIAGLF